MRMQFPKELTHEPQHPVRNGPGNFRASPKQVQDILAACSAHGSIADVRCKALRGLPQATWLPNKEPWDLMWGVIYWRDRRVWFQTLMSPHCCRYFFHFPHAWHRMLLQTPSSVLHGAEQERAQHTPELLKNDVSFWESFDNFQVTAPCQK